MNPRNDDNPKLPQPEIPEEWEPEFLQYLAEMEREHEDERED